MKLKLFILILLCLTACKETPSELPILSYNFIDGKKELYTIDDFECINQNGETITGASTEGIVHTMNFFFTTCPSICPPMRIIQQEIAETFSNERRFKQYSISIDFKRDTLAQLQSYAKLHSINSEEWNLLRGASEVHLEGIAQQLKTNFKPNEDGTDFYHSSYVALMDKAHYIRGFYNILLEEEVELLKADIEKLLD